MKKLYLSFLFFIGLSVPKSSFSQLSATFKSYESRCAATGSIKISVSGGSGNYQFKAEGPVNTNFTTQDSITGLSSGVYKITINDVSSNKTFVQPGIAVGGSYADPRFSLAHTDVFCNKGSNGTITAQNLENGRSPFNFSIISPSPSNVGQSNPSGIFTGLIAGDYSIQLTDSCGGIQTRTVTVNNYTWNINSYGFTKSSCTLGSGYVYVTDSRGGNSKLAALPGFTYGVARSAGDTVWTIDGIFNNLNITGIRSVSLVAKDACGNVKKVSSSLSLVSYLDAKVKISATTCSTFTAAVTNAVNFFSPTYYLYDNNNILISQNSTGVFTYVPYGSYCIKAHDACSDSTITRCFTQSAPTASVDNNISISNKICAGFSASVTGQKNLTNPQYCLLDSNGTVIICNSSGTFDNLAYGKYCIRITDGCIDTTILRCFQASRPFPKVLETIAPAYVTCSSFGLKVTGDSLTNPLYCLYDLNHNLIGSCNNTGTFDSIPLGNYQVTIHDQCTDTTFVRNISVGKPILSNDLTVSISSKDCNSFTATASGTLTYPTFCLFKSLDSTMVTCNSSGVFSGIAYGSYYIRAKNSCPDTTFTNSFSVSRDIPSVNSSVNISNQTCATFSAAITGQTNLINPVYSLIVAYSSDTLQRNMTGKFDNIPYSSYIIQIVSGCNDTLRVPFSADAVKITMNINSVRSCFYGTSKFNISVTGTLPVNIKLFSDNILVTERSFSSNNFSIDSIPALPAGNLYKIVATDACGNPDTLQISPVVGYLLHTPSVTAKCPGSIWPNGSGNIVATVSTNLPPVDVKIVSKNGTNVNISPSNISGLVYTFADLGPATYIIRYFSSDGCGNQLYDTVNVAPYAFPDLKRSSAYQCDNNGFSVGAVVSNGVGPFTYQIFGSSPSTPSLVAPPQADPVFTINNGATYSLIRLRAMDACGNATLGDASILPLVNNGIKATYNCFLSPTTLSVDTIYNAAYQWYKKTNAESTDSVAITNATNYFIPEVLPADTGIYICHIKVNNGCIQRTYYFHLDGSCRIFLPVTVENIEGKLVNNFAQLTWTMHNQADLKEIIVEKMTGKEFQEIAKVNKSGPDNLYSYRFIDSVFNGGNYYRLKMVSKDNSFTYSKIVFISAGTVGNISVYPNPVSNFFKIEFKNPGGNSYRVILSNAVNQKFKDIIIDTRSQNLIYLKRTSAMPPGIYFLHFTNLSNGNEFVEKLIFTNE